MDTIEIITTALNEMNLDYEPSDLDDLFDIASSSAHLRGLLERSNVWKEKDQSITWKFSDLCFKILRDGVRPAGAFAKELDLESPSDLAMFEWMENQHKNGVSSDVFEYFDRFNVGDKEKFIWYLHNQKNLELLRRIAVHQIKEL